MAGLKAFFNGYWLADLTTEVVSSVGKLVSPLGILHAWTQAQYSPQFTLILDSGEIAIQFDEASNGLTYYYDLASGAAQFMFPGSAPSPPAGLSWRLLVEADGTNELTYEGSIFTFGTETAPDFSAMTNGDQVLLDFYVVSVTRVLTVASPVFAA